MNIDTSFQNETLRRANMRINTLYYLFTSQMGTSNTDDIIVTGAAANFFLVVGNSKGKLTEPSAKRKYCAKQKSF